MKNLKETLYKNLLIKEKLIINKNIKINNNKYKYHPTEWSELKELVKKLIEERGNEADLNDIDTSNITDMHDMFYGLEFNGDISKWDVSNVENMKSMFFDSDFNDDISNWDVSNVENMSYMFNLSKFTGENGNLLNWDVSKVKNMALMFSRSKFNGDISRWDVSNVKDMSWIGDISKWNVSSATNIKYMFKDSPLEKNPPKWYKE